MFIYNLDPVLITFNQYALYMLWQCDNIFLKHGYQWFVVSDGKYLSAKTIMMKFFQAM